MNASYSADTDDLDAFAKRSVADTQALAETYNNLLAERSALAAAPLPFFVDQSHLNELDRIIRFVDENGRFTGHISSALTGDAAEQSAAGVGSEPSQVDSTTGVDGGESGMFGAMFNQIAGGGLVDQATRLDRWARQTLGNGSTRAADAANRFFGADVFNRDGWSDFLTTVAKGGMEVYSLNPSSAQHWQLAMSNPDEMRRRYEAYGLGLWEGAKGIATFAHSASSLAAGTPSYAYELHRWNEIGEHRGFVLVDGLTQIAGQLSSLNPTSPAFHTELGEVWETKSIANHDGLQTAGAIVVGIVDWDTFAEDPSRWAGRMTIEGIVEAGTAAIPIGLSDNLGRAAVEAAETAADLSKTDNIVRSSDEVIQPAAPIEVDEIVNSKQWRSFDPELNEGFLTVLDEFGGDPYPPRGLRGGEGQLFLSPDWPDMALKRWHASRLDIFEESVSKLDRAIASVRSDPELDRLIDVAEVLDRGADWIVRDYDPGSVPLKDAIRTRTSGAAEALDEAKALMQNTSDPDLRNIFRKIVRDPPSANVHWSPERQRLFVIDLQ